MSETEADREQQRAGPEAEGLGVTRLEQPRVDAREASREGEEHVTAAEILFEQGDHEKAQEPERAVAKGRAAGEQATVEHEQASATKRKNQNREASESPSQSGKEVGKGARSAETIDGVRAFLDPGHDPGNEQRGEKGDGLPDECEGQRDFSTPGNCFGEQVQEVADDTHALE